MMRVELTQREIVDALIAAAAAKAGQAPTGGHGRIATYGDASIGEFDRDHPHAGRRLLILEACDVDLF